MRLNTKKYQELMAEQELTPKIICKSTGLGARSFQWIMANGFASEDAVERLAEAAGAQVRELLLSDISGTTENAIEFTKHSKRATVTFSQPRYISRIKKLAEKYPEECEIVALAKSTGEGETICAHVPTAWLRITPPAVRDLTDEQRKVIGEKLLVSRQNIADDCNYIAEQT